MADENAHHVSTRDSSDPHKVYPDRSVLGGEVGLWSSDLNALPAPLLTIVDPAFHGAG